MGHENDEKFRCSNIPPSEPRTDDLAADKLRFMEAIQRDEAGQTLFNHILAPMYPGGLKAFTN